MTSRPGDRRLVSRPIRARSLGGDPARVREVQRRRFDQAHPLDRARPDRLLGLLAGARSWRTVPIALVAIVVVTMLLWLTVGRHAATTGLSVGGLLTIPGDLARRAIVPRWRPGWLGVLALDVLGSMLLVAAVGLLLTLPGAFSFWPLVTVLGTACVGLAVAAHRRQGLTRELGHTSLVVLVALAASAIGLAAFAWRPVIPDRIALGQLDTAVAVVAAGTVPSTMPAYGRPEAFPTHYLFYDMIVGALLLVGRHDEALEQLQLMAALRVPAIGLFAVGFGLAGQAFLRSAMYPGARIRQFRAPADSLALAGAGLALPVLLEFNLVTQGKLREALTEGIGLGLIGITLWAMFMAIDGGHRRRRRWLAVAGSATGLLVGIHLPATFALGILVGSLILLALAEAIVRRRSIAPAAREPLPDAARNVAWVGWPMLVLPAIAAIVYDLAGGGSLRRLIGGAVEQVGADPGQVHRALLLFAADPLSPLGPADLVLRYLAPTTMFVPLIHVGLASVLLGLGGLTVVALGPGLPIRLAAWIPLALLGTLAYVDIGPIVGITTVVPWNAIMRNSFYAWVPLAFLGLLGLAGVAVATARTAGFVASLFHRRIDRVAGLVAIAVIAIAFVQPIAREQARAIRQSGWLAPGQMSPAGRAALAWLAVHTDRDARVMTPEVTYGSELIARRRIVTDGKGTLESAEVTSAALESLEGAGRFFLPMRDPSVLLDLEVDYVMAFDDGIYGPGQFGGLPLLRTYLRLMPFEVSPPDLADLPYLALVYHHADIRIFKVDRSLIPATRLDRVAAGAPDPPCDVARCIVLEPVPATEDGPACDPLALTMERDWCVRESQ